MLICPKCGVSDKDRTFVGAFCENCYQFHVSVPKFFPIKTCKRCERVWDGVSWSPYNQKKIEEKIASKFRGDFEKVDYYLSSGTAVIYFRVEGKIYMVHKAFQPTLEATICPECSRKSGGYFESIIQLRGDPSRVQSASKKLIKFLNHRTFVGKIEEKKEGIDLYIGNTKTVFEVLAELGFTHKISRKLFTQKEGRRIYRTTFLIRF